MTDDLDFQGLVNRYYALLYRFALSLTRRESDACDLTQQTFYVWARKGHQLKEPAKVKSWLFTTLHREFLETQRRQTRFPHYELEEMDYDLPKVEPELAQRLDSTSVLAMLAQVDARFQAPVALFYLEDYAYKEIAEILRIPIGTVKSRIARGLAQLQAILASPPGPRAPQEGRRL
jgi:RNA polymerase sigma-70 factor (ECF subfamily)